MSDPSLDPEFDAEFDALEKWMAPTVGKKPLEPARPAPARRPLRLFWPDQPVGPERVRRVSSSNPRRWARPRPCPDARCRGESEPAVSRRLGTHECFIRQGYLPESALEKTWARVDPALIAVFRLGSGDGSLVLADELRALARSLHPGASRSFARRIGRSLWRRSVRVRVGRRLRHERLTVRTVIDAGALASAGSRRFARTMEAVANRMRDGDSLVEALSRHPRHFDPIFLATLQEARSRDEMRRALEQLGESAEAT